MKRKGRSILKCFTALVMSFVLSLSMISGLSYASGKEVVNLEINENSVSAYLFRRMIEDRGHIIRNDDGISLDIYYFSTYNDASSTNGDKGIKNISITEGPMYKNPKALTPTVIRESSVGEKDYVLSRLTVEVNDFNQKIYLWNTDDNGAVRGCTVKIKDSIGTNDPLSSPEVLMAVQTRIFPQKDYESKLPLVINRGGRKLSPYDSVERGKFIQSPMKGVDIRFKKPDFGVSKGETLRYTVDGTEPTASSPQASHLLFRGYGLPPIYESIYLDFDSIKSYVNKNGGDLTLKVRYFDRNNAPMLSSKTITIPYGKRGVSKAIGSIEESSWFSYSKTDFELIDVIGAIPYDVKVNPSKLSNDYEVQDAMQSLGIEDYDAYRIELKEGNKSYKPLGRIQFPQYYHEISIKNKYNGYGSIAVYKIENSKAILVGSQLLSSGDAKFDINSADGKYVVVPNGLDRAARIAKEEARSLISEGQSIIENDDELKDIYYLTQIKNSVLRAKDRLVRTKYESESLLKLERANTQLKEDIREYNLAPALSVDELKDRLSVIMENAQNESLYEGMSKSSVEQLKSKLQEATSIKSNVNATSQELIRIIRELKEALDNLKPAGKYYEVPLRALKEKSDTESMSSKVFNNVAIVKEEGSKSRITIGLKEMKVSQKFAHLEKLYVYPTMNPLDGAPIIADTIETFETIAYDGSKAIMPKTISFERNSTKEEYILAQVETDAMGNSRPYMRLHLDYSKAREVNGGEPYDNPQPPAPRPPEEEDWPMEPIRPEENEEVIRNIKVSLVQAEDPEEPSMASPAINENGQIVKRSGKYYAKLGFKEAQIYGADAYVKHVWSYKGDTFKPETMHRARVLDVYNVSQGIAKGKMIKTFEIELESAEQTSIFAKFEVPAMYDYLPIAQYIFS